MRIWLVAGAVNALVAVAAGAFGAHSLRTRVGPDMIEVWKTGAQYHLIHALGLLAVAYLAAQRPGSGAAWVGWLMLAGIVLFSGSLYAMVLTGTRGFGAVTPVGGVAFLAAWAVFALVALGE